MDLTDEQWAVLEPLFPDPPKRTDGRGRPRRQAREVIGGILWILRTGAPWVDLPSRYPPYQTCHRRFQEWARDGTLRRVVERLARQLREEGVEDIESFIDGSYVPAKKGDPASGNVVPAMRQRSRRLQTALAVRSAYASNLAPATTWPWSMKP